MKPFCTARSEPAQTDPALDSFAGETADNKRSLVVQGDMLGKHRQRLDDHETRLSALEAKS